ncbi:MAG: hypothetical protein KGJ84_10205 [Elusimicrobia bacterium]|nr:hypothetical protein [Elusimicrobiota bacterium]
MLQFETIGYGASVAAGTASFLSPCVLPLVPGYVSFMSGLSLDELARDAGSGRALRHAGWESAFFVLGFSLVFTVLGASATAAGGFLSAHLPVVSMDDEGAPAVRAFTARQPIPYPVVLNGPAEAPAGWAVPGMPTAYLVGRDGRMLRRWIGGKDPDELRAAVEAAPEIAGTKSERSGS